jgi:hypothetical protein
MDLGMRASDEKQKWEKPYKFEPYPAMLYRGIAGAPGWTHCTAKTHAEAQELLTNGEGWRDNLPDALKHFEQLGADIGVAAAERAAADRLMSAKAQAEAKAADDANDGQHLAEVPETPIKKGKVLRKALSPDEQ